MKATSSVETLLESLRPLRKQLVEHDVSTKLETVDDLKTFMEHHVFAVWDFMCLLKSLQSHLTCVTLPWVPQRDSLSCRLINEIVLEEESDEETEGQYISHFELYRAAMGSCGADTSRIDEFVAQVRQGERVYDALKRADVPAGAQAFVQETWKIIETGSVHSIAAAFTVGREEVIPDMFRALVSELHNHFPEQLNIFHNYLERHIHLDEERHTPMAMQMLSALCGKDDRKWEEAEEAARVVLNARITLWDSVVKEIAVAKGKRTASDDSCSDAVGGSADCHKG